MAGASGIYPEHELMLGLVATAERRERQAGRTSELVDRVNWKVLTEELRSQRLVELAGTRLCRLEGDRVPGWFRERVRRTARRTRHRAVLLDAVIASARQHLDRAGIPSAELKGPGLAQRIHGDPGLRSSVDLDLLVAREQLPDAIAVLRRQGWGEPTDPACVGALPLLHYRLPPRRPGLPALELHWRIHWYESALTDELLDGCECGSLAPAHDLAALLLFYARDGFVGLRYAADVAAWWDLHGSRLGGPPLDPLLAGHPALRNALVAAAQAADRLVGVPAEALATDLSLPSRARTAVRVANWSLAGGRDQVVADLTLTDWLLTPRGGQRAFALRHLFPPLPVARLRRLSRGSALAARLAVKWSRALARARQNPRPQALHEG